MPFRRLFTDHPASVGESYFEHMATAFGFGAKMVICGGACLLHGIFPFLFKCTARQCIEDLHTRVVTHRVKDCNKDKVAAPEILQPAE